MEKIDEKVSDVPAAEPTVEAAEEPAEEPTEAAPSHHWIGIDIGGEKSVIGYYEEGKAFPIILTNKLNNVSTPTIISFAQNVRKIGEDAYPSRLRYPKDLYDNLLHRCYQADSQKKIPLTLYERSFSLSYGHLLSMYVDDILSLVPEGLSEEVTHYAMVIPSRLTLGERQRILCSLQAIKGGKVKLVSSCKALGLGYYYRHHSNEEKKGEEDDMHRKVVIVDIGRGHSSAHSYTISNHRVQVHKSVSIPQGGDVLDEVLYEEVKRQIREKVKVEVVEGSKVSARVRAAVSKTKLVLSTLDEARVDVENVDDGVDFGGMVKRSVLDNLPYFAALKEMLQGMGEQPEVVEIVGGGTRVPIIQQIVSNAFGIAQVSRTLDSATCVGQGAALALSEKANILGYDEGVEEEVDMEVLVDEDGEYVDEVRDVEQYLEAEERKVKAAEEAYDGLERYLSDLKMKWTLPRYREIFEGNAEEGALRELMERVRGELDEIEPGTEKEKVDKYRQEVETMVAESFPLFLAEEEKVAEEQEADRKAGEEERARRVKSSGDKAPRTNRQKLAAGEMAKRRGNTLFQQLDFKAACNAYVQGISVLNEMFDVHPDDKIKAEGLQGSLYLNAAQCLIKLERYKQAASNCEKAIELQASLKGYYRLATAREKMKDFEGAEAALKLAQACDPESKEVGKMMKRVQKGILKMKEKEKKMYGAMFG